VVLVTFGISRIGFGFDSVRIPCFGQEAVFAQAVCVYVKHLEELLVSGVELLVGLIIRVFVRELISWDVI
jgi:hypothetical protein